jgi:NRPS condensation-like uncharacterized protein
MTPLSETQQQIWVTEQLEPGRSVFTEAMPMRVHGPVDPDVLATALAQVGQRHDVLRTVFVVTNGTPTQRVDPDLVAPLQRADLSPLSEAHRNQALSQLTRTFVDGRRDLAVESPLRALLVTLAPEKYALVVSVHHLVCDGWSAGMVLNELTERYAALLAEQDYEPEPPPLTYTDFVAWEQDLLASEFVTEDLEFWRTNLHGATPLELVPGRARPAEKGMVGRIGEFALDDTLADGLLTLCQEKNVTPYVAMLGVFAAVAARWSGQPDIVVGAQAANRVRSELENVVGQFANTVPIRLDLGANPTFDALLDHARQASADASDRAHVPLRRIVTVAAPARDLSRPVLIQHLFTPREQPVKADRLGPARLEPFMIDRRRARLDTLTEIDVRPGRLRALVEYDTALFDEPTITALVADWTRCLHTWLIDPTTRVHDLPLHGPPEQEAPPVEVVPATPTSRAPSVEHLTALVASVWQEYLEVPEVTAEDDFFVLGGHSMLVARVLYRLRDLLNADLPLRALFDHTTVRGFAEEIELRVPGLEESLRALAAMPQQDFEDLVDLEPAPARTSTDTLPLLAAQLPIWLAEQRDPGRLTHTIPVVVTIHGRCDTTALRMAIQRVVDRHEGLRATFPAVDGVPVQRIAPTLTMDVPVIRITESERDSRRTELGHHTFDVANGPLLAARILKVREQEHLLQVVFHHLVTDEVSMTVFLRELSEVYEAIVEGRPARLADLPSMADCVAWERRHLEGDELARLTGFWRRQLAGAPYLEVPTDRPRPEKRAFDGEFLSVAPPVEAYGRIAAVARDLGVTPFTVFTATVLDMLHTVTGEADLLVGVPSDNRIMPGSERLIGCFLNVLPLRVDASGDPTFAELVRRVRDALVTAYDHQALPLARIAEAVGAGRATDRPPLFGITCELQLPGWLPARLCGASLTYDFVSHGTARYEMAFHVMVFPAGVFLGLELNTGLWHESTGMRLLAHLESRLAGLEVPA